MVDLPRYNPISSLPNVKSNDVTAAPIQTSLQATFVSGRTLKSIPKSSVITPNDKRKLTDSNQGTGAGRACAMNVPMAASAALNARDTNNKKPVPRTKPNERQRFLMAHTQKLSDLGLVLQILFSVS